MDHYTPCCSVDAAETHKKMRQFGRDQGLKYVYDSVGVCHQVMLEYHAKPGDFIIGADSHTCSREQAPAVLKERGVRAVIARRRSVL